ncbi:amino acid ABC transporter substrate-binding protein [Streptomyces sp. ISL-66]|uniref:ABC transporter substrate-binding protein n=1 Tax=Streptomyces sp. ISL-66 TaxID=2819186 RepID=UPI001BED02CD|nr:ABC transporter substrate-binding protein [Streptomyces sp. ISL-66]MBT2468373.1 amino acid ABC transporter substrate-binding protein [Streptomyces sp. ISL-66]
MKLWPDGPLYRALLIAAAAVVLGVGGYLAYDQWFSDDPACATGVVERGPRRECVGVTDGSYVFSKPLEQVTDRIKAENDSLAGKSPATVALMIPMISDTAAEQREYVEQVQGAYLAQYRANHDANNKQPPIRLVLANPGRGYKEWRTVADQLVRAAADKKENLRAVAGINISITETEQAVRYLTKDKGIPVVAGPMTADDIKNTAADPHGYPGLARIAPSNTDQADALASYGSDIKPVETMVVEDIREGDNYLTTLRQTFEKLAMGAPNAPETFRSPPDFNDEGNLANDFHQMVPDICASAAKTIYFAGRPVQLRQFLVELGNRTCNKPYTVISGSHASTLTVDEKFAGQWGAFTKGAGITLRYTALAHPDAWGEKSTEATGGSKAALKELSDLLQKLSTKEADSIGPANLLDGRVIIMYDAVSTAIAGIRNDTVGGVKMPSLPEVADSWLRLHGNNRVEGASGWICLDQYGNPYNKAISIVHLDPATKTAAFDGIAWPSGHAPDVNCSIVKGG